MLVIAAANTTLLTLINPPQTHWQRHRQDGTGASNAVPSTEIEAFSKRFNRWRQHSYELKQLKTSLNNKP